MSKFIEEGDLGVIKAVLKELIKQVLKLNIITQNTIGVLGINTSCDLYTMLTQQQNNLGELYRILEGDYKNE